MHTNTCKNTFWNTVKTAFNCLFLITGFKLLKLLSVVCEFGWQTFICKNYMQNICSVYKWHNSILREIFQKNASFKLSLMSNDEQKKNHPFLHSTYQEWMIFARIGDGSCYYLWNEICTGVTCVAHSIISLPLILIWDIICCMALKAIFDTTDSILSRIS